MGDPMSVTAKQIADHLGLTLLGPDVAVTRPYPADAAEAGAFVFVKEFQERWVELLGARKDICLLAAPGFAGRVQGGLIESGSPRLDFARALARFFMPREERVIAPTARIHPSATIGADVAVGDFTVIGAGVVVGEGTVIRSHVVIYPDTRIGKRCLVKSSTVIGEEGFGFEFDAAGVPIRIPHLGRVVLGDDVEIGSMNVIARGTLGDTVLSHRVKTDDHVFIAHNVFIGENSVVIAGAEVSGSVKIGRDVWIAPQATIINKVSIGDRAMVGIGAVVTRSVEAGMIVVGNPATVLKKR